MRKATENRRSDKPSDGIVQREDPSVSFLDGHPSPGFAIRAVPWLTWSRLSETRNPVSERPGHVRKSCTPALPLATPSAQARRGSTSLRCVRTPSASAPGCARSLPAWLNLGTRPDYGHAEPDVPVPVPGKAPAADRRPAEPAEVDPAAATQDPVRGLSRLRDIWITAAR